MLNTIKKKAFIEIMIGIFIFVPSCMSTIISFLKMFYFRLSDGSRFGDAIAAPFKSIVSYIYTNTTPWLDFFWNNSPTPDPHAISSSESISTFVIYGVIFIGMAFISSGKKKVIKILKINEAIDEQMLKESLEGRRQRPRSEIERTVDIPSEKFFTQFHTLYIAPIVTGIIIAILTKFVGM
ncbi:hypothetical protein QMU95_003913 [Aeromonas veronii]|uniref:YniB family protein n=1 Tax=Aeromonas veronii TaxID=654 RepID=UPI00244498CF|nr:YniB family protein [Aeromonas veronii]ELV7510467.1 hypothetical protein [Aeromonas veronii]